MLRRKAWGGGESVFEDHVAALSLVSIAPSTIERLFCRGLENLRRLMAFCSISRLQGKDGGTAFPPS